MTRTRGRREYAGEALAERGRSSAESRANKPISLGSPIQTAAYKMAAFSLFSKAFSEFECRVFENGVLGSFYELVYKEVFVF